MKPLRNSLKVGFGDGMEEEKGSWEVKGLTIAKPM
jgi:hypothetical protein